MTRTEYRFSGFGGQGVITITHILGGAATVHAGMDATMTEAYGPEKTGGFSRGDLVVSDDEIDYPAVIEPDVVVAFSQDAFERDADSVTEEGMVIVEANLVDASEFRERRPDVAVIEVPAVEVADDIGLKVVANIVMLGAVHGLTEFLPEEALRQAILDIVPEGTEETNMEAFERGLTALETEVTA